MILIENDQTLFEAPHAISVLCIQLASSLVAYVAAKFASKVCQGFLFDSYAKVVFDSLRDFLCHFKFQYFFLFVPFGTFPLLMLLCCR